MKNAELHLSGIKCDNPDCDYFDTSVTFEEYPQYVNKPCPKCKCNLLTEEDYNLVLTMMKVSNFIIYLPKGKGPIVETSFSLNGTGNIKIENIKIKNEV